MKKNGFTMIEIVVTISMILVASSILIGTIIGITRRNEEQKLKDIESAVISACQIYVSDHGKCPDNTGGTTAFQKLVADRLIAKDMENTTKYTITIPTDATGEKCEASGVGGINVTKI